MIREIIKDTDILRTVSVKINPKDENTKRIIQDLLDTAEANRGNCVGLAAIQINEPVRIIVVFDGEKYIPYINPVITKRFGAKYVAEEGCMSIEGTREVERYADIEVMHQTRKGFSSFLCHGYLAEIIQHEVDHLNGKLI